MVRNFKLIKNLKKINNFFYRKVFGKSEKPPPVATKAADTLLSSLIEGFLLTVTCRGQIVLISSSVEQYLGHCQVQFPLLICNF